jgi:hypothetical protein
MHLDSLSLSLIFLGATGKRHPSVRAANARIAPPSRFSPEWLF